MTKFFTLAAVTAIVAAVAKSTAAKDTKDSCVFVDFTAETSEFDELNAALDLVKSASVFGSVLDKFDPLVLSKIPLDSFKYSILGQDLKITPTISSINITGLSTVVPKSINVTSANTVDISADSEEQVSVDASLKVSTNLFGASATAQVKFTMEKPTFMGNVEANMYACAPDVSTDRCSNMTVAGLEVDVLKAAVFGNYKSVMKKILMKFESASVKSFKLDFASVSEFSITFDSSSMLLSSVSDLLTDFSAESVNQKGAIYKKVIFTISSRAPAVINRLIKSKLQPMFGATCLSEE